MQSIHGENLRKGAFAVAVFVETPEGIPLVMDPYKPNPWWKFAGGRSEAGEDAQTAACREIYEELGFKLNKNKLLLLCEENRDNHKFALFKTDLDSLDGMRVKGLDNEKIKVFTLDEIKNLSDFMPNHKRILQQLGII